MATIPSFRALSLSNVKRHRAFLMGVAALLVVCCHFNNHIAGGAVGRLLAEGYIGVDIFIFCSAIGLVQSYSRRPAALAFYRKRVVRILPTFLAVTLAVLVFAAILGTKDLHLRDWAMTLSTLGYWTGDAFFEWYTPAILALYALFPLLYQACSIKMGGYPADCKCVMCVGCYDHVKPVPLLAGGTHTHIHRRYTCGHVS